MFRIAFGPVADLPEYALFGLTVGEIFPIDPKEGLKIQDVGGGRQNPMESRGKKPGMAVHQPVFIPCEKDPRLREGRGDLFRFQLSVRRDMYFQFAYSFWKGIFIRPDRFLQIPGFILKPSEPHKAALQRIEEPVPFHNAGAAGFPHTGLIPEGEITHGIQIDLFGDPSGEPCFPLGKGIERKQAQSGPVGLRFCL